MELESWGIPEAAYVASFANTNKTPAQLLLQTQATSAARAATVFDSKNIRPAGEQTERERREYPRPKALKELGKLLSSQCHLKFVSPRLFKLGALY